MIKQRKLYMLYWVFSFLILACTSTQKTPTQSGGQNGQQNGSQTGQQGNQQPGKPNDPLGGSENIPTSIFIDNQLTQSSAPACIYADPNKLVSLFNASGQQTLGSGKTGPYTVTNGQFGLQVNFWYWAQTAYMSHSIGSWSCSKGTCNNPDNSGAQFTLGAGCTIASKSPPVYGVGKETYIITDVSAGMQNSDCVVTIKPNQYTACVTPSCCSYFAAGQCSEGSQGTYATGCMVPPP